MSQNVACSCWLWGIGLSKFQSFLIFIPRSIAVYDCRKTHRQSAVSSWQNLLNPSLRQLLLWHLHHHCHRWCQHLLQCWHQNLCSSALRITGRWPAMLTVKTMLGQRNDEKIWKEEAETSETESVGHSGNKSSVDEFETKLAASSGDSAGCRPWHWRESGCGIMSNWMVPACSNLFQTCPNHIKIMHMKTRLLPPDTRTLIKAWNCESTQEKKKHPTLSQSLCLPNSAGALESVVEPNYLEASGGKPYTTYTLGPRGPKAFHAAPGTPVFINCQWHTYKNVPWWVMGKIKFDSQWLMEFNGYELWWIMMHGGSWLMLSPTQRCLRPWCRVPVKTPRHQGTKGLRPMQSPNCASGANNFGLFKSVPQHEMTSTSGYCCLYSIIHTYVYVHIYIYVYIPQKDTYRSNHT